MAKFVYRMSSYLSLKGKLEEQKKLEYGKALNQVQFEKDKKIELEMSVQHTINNVKNSINTRINPIDIHANNTYINALGKKIIQQDEVISKAERFAESKRLELVEAVKQRKMLETLKEKRYEEYLREEKLAEQKSLDEVASYKHFING